MSPGIVANRDIRLVVAYDGSPPSRRALDAAIGLMQGRTGRIHVVYVAHMPSTAMMSGDAYALMESDFDSIEQELRGAADDQLRDRVASWGFERRSGVVADELMAAAKAIQEDHPTENLAVVVGSSSHAMHRVIGSVAVNLARHSPVPLVIVP